MLLVALGWRIYVQDPYNTIDAIIVILSCVELVISLVQGRNVIEYLGSDGILATFRVFRTFRILKIINNWKKLRQLLTTAVGVIKDMRYFMLILFVYLLVASLLGMQFFAYKIRYNQDGTPYKAGLHDISKTHSPRLNFDNFPRSFMSNFVILAQDNWVGMMHGASRMDTPRMVPIAFFVIGIVLGNMIL